MSVEKLYNDEKSRGFVNHLIHSYLPVNKVTKVWDFTDKKIKHTCSICGHELIDLTTVMTRMSNSKEFMSDFTKQLRNDINGIKTPKEEHFIIKHVTHGAIQAFTGKGTTTYLCQDCVKELLDFVSTGLLMGDKNIVYQINKMRRTSMFNHFNENPALNEHEKKTVKEIQSNVEKNKKHTATFGDLEVLQNLKKKMEQNNK